MSFSKIIVAGLCTRIEVCKHAGYFEPGQADTGTPFTCCLFEPFQALFTSST